MFTAQTLLTALARTKRAVKVVALDGSHVLMSPAQASALAARAEDWEGFGTKRKISSIRRVGPRPGVKPDPVWAECWRTAEAAILPPSPEWFAAVS